jgi:hypothetical protein
VLGANLQADIRRMPPPTMANLAGIGDLLKRVAGSIVPRRARGGRNDRRGSVQSGEQVLRNRDRGHLERDSARVADDLRADPNRRWAVAHKIGAYE